MKNVSIKCQAIACRGAESDYSSLPIHKEKASLIGSELTLVIFESHIPFLITLPRTGARGPRSFGRTAVESGGEAAT